jgi:hypothetical protein
MQPDKIAMSMNDFEKAFESIEVSLGTMTGALETTTGSLVRCTPLILQLLFGFKLTRLQVPTDEVDALMQAVAQVRTTYRVALPLLIFVTLCIRNIPST